jgi:hypothetical protein
MRYRLPALMLLAVLPLMNVLGAPAPQPYAILDIASPPKGKTAEEHCKDLVDRLTNAGGYLWFVGNDPKVGKLSSVAHLKDLGPWLEKNIRITEEDGGRRLRLTFRAGTRAEQVVIINTLLRYYLRQGVDWRIPGIELALRPIVEGAPRIAKLIKEEQDPVRLARWQKGAEDAIVREADLRDELARLKQVAVIKWAK